MLQWVIKIQKDIYISFAAHIKDFANFGDWNAFLVFLPAGVLFGTVHAITPGHCKTLLSSYLVGSSSGLGRALITTMSL